MGHRLTAVKSERQENNKEQQFPFIHDRFFITRRMPQGRNLKRGESPEVPSWVTSGLKLLFEHPCLRPRLDNYLPKCIGVLLIYPFDQKHYTVLRLYITRLW